jgi:hypothetical protein
MARIPISQPRRIEIINVSVVCTWRSGTLTVTTPARAGAVTGSPTDRNSPRCTVSTS